MNFIRAVTQVTIIEIINNFNILNLIISSEFIALTHV